MRAKSKNTAINSNITNVQGYHETSTCAVNYAYQGFKANKYFTSDRPEKLDANFNRLNGKPLKGYGLEIETECKGIKIQSVYAEILNKIIFPHFMPDLFKLQRDGSLSGGDTSAEIISQVMTKEFIRNSYPAFKSMYNDYFSAFGISCVRTGNCGMHVNMSNALFGNKEEAQELAIKKLLYIVNKHFHLFCTLTNRDPMNTGYCSRMSRFAIKENCKNANLSTMGGSHYICFNASHYTDGRIELRIVGGQKDFACFRNTMESIFHVVDAVKKISWEDCDDLSKIFAGCNQYVFDRLNTKCKSAGAIGYSDLEKIAATVKHEQLL